MKLPCCTPHHFGGALRHQGTCALRPNEKLTDQERSQRAHPAKGTKVPPRIVLDDDLAERYHLASNRPYGCGEDDCPMCYGTPFEYDTVEVEL